jgi:hypothetical protein
MRARTTLLALALAPALLLPACGGDDADEQAATTTEAPATTMAATTTTVATTTTESRFPTYDQFLATLSVGADVCGTGGGISGTPLQMSLGPYSDGGPMVASIRGGATTILCVGAKLEVVGGFEGVNQYGEPLQEGSLFTVAEDGTFVELSEF